MTHSRLLFALCAVSSLVASADPPSVFYIFPAGGQRGATVDLRIGGHYLYDKAAWEMNGPGIKSSPEIIRTKRIWFEGPLIKQPASQQKEDYPQDYLGQVQIAADAPLGGRTWQAWNAQGVTPGLRFVVGSLPEVVEQEADGQPIPTQVSLPVTINGRVFPREDVDIWTFDAAAGQSITCSVEATTLGLLNDPQLPKLEAQIEVRDPQGRVVNAIAHSLRVDPELRFTAAESGTYQIRIWDSKFSGLQHFVYRLTVTNGPWISASYPLGGRRGEESEIEIVGQGIPGHRLKVRWPEMPRGIVSHSFDQGGEPLNPVLCDVDDLPEVLEPASGELPRLAAPGVANGRIEQAGDMDAWKFTATKGTPLRIEVRAARLGSPLDAVLVIKDSSDKELAQADDLPGGSPDCELMFTAPADGEYVAEVRDRFASRGGPAFAYRLRIGQQEASYFALTFTSDAIAVPIGGEAKLPVNVERRGGFNAPVKLSVQGLPSGISAADVEVPANQNKGEIVVKVAKETPVQSVKLAVVGVGGLGEPLTRKAATMSSPGEPPADSIRLACTLATPFKFKSQYEFRYIARGGTLKKHYLIERNGFEGPLEVSLANRQGRHLQGVTGPTVTIPAGVSEFDYTVTLPPWMELGRTSRSNLMLVGEVADAAGKKHKVSYSTNDQNEQLIALVTASPLRLSLDKSAVACQANSQLTVPVHLHRQVGLTGPCRVELVVPEHMRDIAAQAVEIAGSEDQAVLNIDLGKQPGPLNMPLLIRGQTQRDGEPVIAEVSVELLLKAN